MPNADTAFTFMAVGDDINLSVLPPTAKEPLVSSHKRMDDKLRRLQGALVNPAIDQQMEVEVQLHAYPIYCVTCM